MKSVLRHASEAFRSMTSSSRGTACGPAAAAAAVTADGSPSAASRVAAASKRLSELSEVLAVQGVASAPQVTAALQQLAQELLQLPPTQPNAAGAAATCSAAADGAPSAADVDALERSYAAPAAAAAATAAAAADPDHLAAAQPLSKRQRQAARAGGYPRVFDISMYAQRTVVLQLMYVGWSYQGFARQADSENTIEGVLFPALRRVKLIAEDADVSDLGYSRCGRTDKGVSALGQVLCLRMRSAALAGQPLPDPEQELDYPTLINRSLPDSIRILGWADAPGPDFSARFSCGSREYKYFIVQDGGLDLGAMRQAAQHLVGQHDFRHFCKADVVQVQNYIRKVLSVSLEPVHTCCPGMTVLALHIKGTAFLWHQVRFIAAVLLLVGRGQEQPDVVQQLLDIGKVPCKPQFNMADKEPLLLYRCHFADLQQWHCSQANLTRSLAAVNAQLQQHLVGAALNSAIYEQLQQQWQQQQQQLYGSNNGNSIQQQQQQQLCGSNNGSHVHQQRGKQAGQAQQQQQVGGSSNGDSAQQQRGGQVGQAQQQQQQQKQKQKQQQQRWMLPNRHHVPLLKRGREPSIEERFEKAGISLELLNQPGAAKLGLQQQQAG